MVIKNYQNWISSSKKVFCQTIKATPDISYFSKLTMKKTKPNPSWQDLDPFLLSNIFSFLSLHDQLFGPPFVCHSWLSASLDILFHNSILDLRAIDELDEESQRLRYAHLLKLTINRYHGWVSITFPQKHIFKYFATTFIAERTPKISCVFLPCDGCFDVFPIFVSVIYWKNLKVFHATFGENVGAPLFLSQLGDYCKNIVELGVHGKFKEREIMSCLVKGFPLLKVLDLSRSTLACDAFLATVLDGKRLKCIKEINVLHCIFLGDDGKDVREDYLKMKDFKKEMLKKVAKLNGLKKFMHCDLAKSTCQDCNCKDK